MFIFDLLADSSSASSSAASSSASSSSAVSSSATWLTTYGSYIFLGVLVVAFVAIFIWQNKKSKKQQAEQEATKNSIRPGNKVKTIGGICGIVVEVNPEESTFVLETGSEVSGKSYMKFDMQAIYQTDAKPVAKAEDKKTEKDVKSEAKPEEKAEAKTEEKVEEKTEKKEEE